MLPLLQFTFYSVILKSKDEIAVTAPSKTVYIFLNLSQEDNDFLPTELSNKYVTVEQLGRGACGEVRLVKHRVRVSYLSKLVNEFLLLFFIGNFK